MKSINKFLSIVNIASIIFFIILTIMSNDFFEVTVSIFSTIPYVLLGIINLIVGIKNIRNNNKKIGICFIILAIVLITMQIFLFLYQILKKEIYGDITLCSKLLIIVLSIITLISNRKVENNSKHKSIIIAICSAKIIEIVLSTIVLVFAKINTSNIKKAVKILSEEPKKQIITYEWIDNSNETNCDFYDSNGHLISSKKYKILRKNVFQSNTQAQDTLTVLTVSENNKTWIVNSEGEKVARLYKMFENTEKNIYFHHACNVIIKRMNYEYLSKYKSTSDRISLLKLQDSNNNSFLFGNLSVNGYQLNVVLNYNELESDTKLQKIYDSHINKYSKYSYYEYSDDQIDLLNNMYKYKKDYYLINKNGEKKKIDCNNIFFTFDNQDELAVWTYSNRCIPIYDSDKNGYINLNGNCVSLPNRYIVFDALNNYQIVYDYETTAYYILSYDNKLLIDEAPTSIEFYNDNYLVTDEYAYVFQNNKFTKISNNKLSTHTTYVDSINFINITDSYNNPLPYNIITPFDKLDLDSEYFTQK